MKLLGRYKNGNVITTICDDGTKERVTMDDEFKPAFAENMDIKISNKCSAGCPYCHEGSTPDGKLADIMNEKFIETLHPYQEVALGGGDVFEHPDLIPFLRKLKELKVIANITVNQIHFEKYYEVIKALINEKLIYGLGISLVNPTDDFISKAKQFPNAVIHVINGIFTAHDYMKLMNHDLKILILGYKHIRRGNDYFERETKQIDTNQRMLYENVADMLNVFKVVSFDNLALEQLNIKRIVSDKEWEEFYAGDDGTFTYYIDMVERKFAKSSTTPFDKRYVLLDNVDEMFGVIKGE